jgi:citrate lyase subunit beta/citryl-CoA lyase
MRLRSLLFVPGDRPDRMDKARGAGADAVILDLEDAVAHDRKADARRHVAECLGRRDGNSLLLVRVNALNSGMVDADLGALAKAPPDCYVLPKSEGCASVAEFCALVEAAGCAQRPVLPIVAETATSVFTLGQYAQVADRLMGLTWGVEDLRGAIGASTGREPGGFTPAFALVRSLTLFAAHAAGVAAIEAVYPNFRDDEGLSGYAARAARDGFGGMLAIHPAQVPVINAAFTPSADEIGRARRILAAFRDHTGEGAVGLDGVMLDAVHLRQATQVIARADAGSDKGT